MIGNMESKAMKSISMVLFVAVFFSIPFIPQKGYCHQINDKSQEYLRNGLKYYRNGLYDKALDEFQAAIKLNPELSTGYYNVGVVFYLKGDYKSARDNFLKAVELDDKSADSYFNLGLAYYQLGDYKESASQLRKAIKLNSNDAESYLNLALSYKKLGKIKEANKAYESYITLQSDLADRSDRLAKISIKGLRAGDKINSDNIAIGKCRGPIFDYGYHSYRYSTDGLRGKGYKKFQIGFSVGPSFPENYNYKLLSVSPDRISYSAFAGMSFPRGSGFLGAFGGDGYGFALKFRKTSKENGLFYWKESSFAADIRIFEDINSTGSAKFFISFGPGVFLVKTKTDIENDSNSEFGVEMGAGFDYLLFSFVSIFGEGSYAFCYHGERMHTNSIGYAHLGLSLNF